MRSVRVRDSAIDVFGETPHTARTLKEPPVAGYTSGALGNQDLKGFALGLAELHGLVVKLGQGDDRCGLSRGVSQLTRNLVP